MQITKKIKETRYLFKDIAPRDTFRLTVETRGELLDEPLVKNDAGVAVIIRNGDPTSLITDKTEVVLISSCHMTWSDK